MSTTSSNRNVLVFIAVTLAVLLLFAVPEARAGTLQVIWDEVTADDLAGYRLSYGTDGVNFTDELVVPDPDAVSRDVTGLAVGETY